MSGRAISVSCLLCALLFAPGAGAAPLDQRVVDWARDYYGGGDLCSTARVSGLEFGDGILRVSLEIDPRWARSLVKTSAEIRDRWFALHCPPRMLPVWSFLSVGQDVVVDGILPELGSYRLGCREYLQRRESDRRRRAN